MIAGLGLILGAAYGLWLYRRVMLGALEKHDLMKMGDLKLSEKIVFAPLVVMVFYLGIYPTALLENTEMASKTVSEKMMALVEPDPNAKFATMEDMEDFDLAFLDLSIQNQEQVWETVEDDELALD